jgi:hypothetical protein
MFKKGIPDEPSGVRRTISSRVGGCDFQDMKKAPVSVQVRPAGQSKMIHILFSSSATGILRPLLRARGLKDRVIDLTETLDWGPISTGSFEDRGAWFDRHVPSTWEWDWIADEVDEFREAVATDPERLIWIAPRSATEQSGLYWYLAQFGRADARMIVADYPLRNAWRGEAPIGLGGLQPEAMADLLDECPRVPVDPFRFPEERWKSLMEENALIRIVDGGVLRSVPDTYFDQLLLAHCPAKWTNWRRVVGDTLVCSWDFDHNPCEQLLLWRLRELIQSGKIVCDGELPPYGTVPASEVSVRRAL